MCVSQGEFHHWVPLFNYFDDFFEKTIKARSDLQLLFEDDAPVDPPFPTAAVLAVLRATAVILENCGNKHFWASYEV
jgi:hypothetical protein